ncbi:organic hydroperoxide reductase OsmC/OhrA [Nakamurella sp. UYEF19]|uniref:OsmC family protein n=1 Tax=Nakamurella sp. UYEF19 TaxID=1756392 RepID=UPI003396E485
MTTTTNRHTYHAHVLWTGSTKSGYRNYTRFHRAVAPPAPEVPLSADPHFRGDPAYLNPEQLLVMAASSCQLLSFLSVAALHHLEILDYDDDAHGEMSDTGQPMRITHILLRPVITVATDTDHALVEPLVQEAHHGCYIANTLNSDVIVQPTVVTA